MERAGDQPARGSAIREHLSAPLFRNAYFLILSSTLTSALGLPFWALAARNYTAASLGRASAVISALSLISGTAQLGLEAILPRYLPGSGDRTLRFVLRAYGLSAAVALVLGTLAAWTSQWWSPPLSFLGGDASWFLLFVASAVTWTISSLQDSVMTGLHKARWVPVENVSFGLAKIVLVVMLAASYPRAGVVLSWSAPLVLILIPVNAAIFVRFIPRHVRLTAGLPQTWASGDLRRLLIGNFAGDFSSLVIAFYLPILVLNLAGPRQAAYFFVPWTISIGLRYISQNMATSMTVETGYDEAKRRRNLLSASVGTFRLLVPAVIVVLIAGPFILGLFGHGYERAGTSALRLLALGTIPHAVSTLGLGLARVRHDGRFVGIVQVTDACVMLALSALLVPSIGIEGAAVGWIAAQTVAAAMSGRLLWRAVRGPAAVVD